MWKGSHSQGRRERYANTILIITAVYVQLHWSYIFPLRNTVYVTVVTQLSSER